MNSDFETTYKLAREELQRVHAAILETAAMATKESCSEEVQKGLCLHLGNLLSHHNRLAGTIDVLLSRALSSALEPDTEEGPGPEKLLEDALSGIDAKIKIWEEETQAVRQQAVRQQAMRDEAEQRIKDVRNGRNFDLKEIWPKGQEIANQVVDKPDNPL